MRYWLHSCSSAFRSAFLSTTVNCVMAYSSRSRLASGSRLQLGCPERGAVLTVLRPRNRLKLHRGDKVTSADLRRLFARNGHVDHLSPINLHGDKLHSPQRKTRVPIPLLRRIRTLLHLRVRLTRHRERNLRRVNQQTHSHCPPRRSIRTPAVVPVVPVTTSCIKCSYRYDECQE